MSFDLYLPCWFASTLSMSSLKVKVIDQRSWSEEERCWSGHCDLKWGRSRWWCTFHLVPWCYWLDYRKGIQLVETWCSIPKDSFWGSVWTWSDCGKEGPLNKLLSNSIRSSSFDVIIIIVWLVRCWTLPFLRASSRLDDAALDDRQLPDQCWVVLNWFQQSRARCDAIGLIGGSTPLAKGPHRPKSSTVVHSWIGTCSVTVELKVGGMDDVCEWWLVSMSKDFLIKNAGLPRIV